MVKAKEDELRNLSCNYQIFVGKEERIKKTHEKYWIYKFKDGHTKRILSFMKFDKDLETELQKGASYVITGKLNNIYGHIYPVIETIKVDKKNN